MRVVEGAAVPRKVLRAGERPRRAAAVDPGGHMLRHAPRIGAESAVPDDGVARLVGEIGNGREDEVDPEGTCLPARDLACAAGHLEIVQKSERRRGWQRGGPIELLPGAALEI